MAQWITMKIVSFPNHIVPSVCFPVGLYIERAVALNTNNRESQGRAAARPSDAGGKWHVWEAENVSLPLFFQFAMHNFAANGAPIHPFWMRFKTEHRQGCAHSQLFRPHKNRHISLYFLFFGQMKITFMVDMRERWGIACMQVRVCSICSRWILTFSLYNILIIFWIEIAAIRMGNRAEGCKHNT